MRLTLRALAALAAVVPLLGAAVRAQDAAGTPAPSRARDVEPASISRLTGITLPEGALRVTDAKMLGEFNTSLKTIATQGGFTLGQTEALLWGGPAHTSARNKELKDALTQALAKSGYNYQAAGETDLKEGKVTLFLAAKTGAPQATLMAGAAPAGQATLGIFVANDGYLALAWGAITPKGDKETPKADAPAAKPQPPAGKGAVPADMIGNWMWTTISSVNYRDTITNQLLEPSGMAVRMSFGKDGRYTFFFYIRQRTYNLVTAATTTHEGTVTFNDDNTFTLRPARGHYKGSTGSRIIDRDMTEEERKPTVYHWEWRTEDGKRKLYMGPGAASMSLFKPAE